MIHHNTLIKRLFILTLALLAISSNANATHNRAGSITYVHLFGTTYEFTVTTCTRSTSEADRPELVIDYGDGSRDTIERITSLTEVLPAYEVQKNYYKGVHTFTGATTYTISVEDPNRNAGVVNIVNSVDKVFCIQTELVISPFIGDPNNSLIIEDCPCPTFGCVNEIFCFNLSAYDPDGDSLSYSLIPCKGEDCLDMAVPEVYRYPPDVGGGVISIDPVTGTLCWDAPLIQGVFNVAIKISEWREGIFVGSVIQDLQFNIVVCSHQPPDISVVPDTCVFVGDNIDISVTATDSEDFVTLFATGAIFNLSDNPASFPETTGFLTTSSNFTWTPNCNNASETPYSVVLHADDDNNIQLTDIKSFNIKVNIPPVTGLTANPVGNSIELDWDDALCAGTYNIYRSTDSSSLTFECCDPNAALIMGYELIGTSTTSDYVDNSELVVGNEYCYLITVVSGNNVEGCISEQVCSSLKFEVPILTHVSIATTDASTGEDSVYWATPKELNTTAIPGPYHYQLYRSEASSGMETLVLTTPPQASIVNPDTVFYDSGLNTADNAYTYRVELYSDGTFIGSSIEATSIYASTIPNDNQLEITWVDDTPWSNDTFVVYRETFVGSGVFDSIGFTLTNSYIDDTLTNGVQYCYKVKSIGRYSADGIVRPIENWSQETCGVPFDFTPPCSPTLSVDVDCELEETYLIWNNPNNSCADDVTRYNIYFAPFEGDSLMYLTTLNSDADTSFVHAERGSVAGCYYVTALDSIQYDNESEPSTIVCVDNCDGFYELPNVFTPDGSNVNDFYHPILPIKFVDSVDFNVYNRWGDLVFKTNDPLINWDGTDMDSGKPLADGVYTYTIIVYEIKLEGYIPRSFHGIIHIANAK